jgi:hypothetical protein
VLLDQQLAAAAGAEDAAERQVVVDRLVGNHLGLDPRDRCLLARVVPPG